MRRLLLFGGTTEGRRLAQAALHIPLAVTVCVATNYGEELLPPGCVVQIGRLDARGMETMMRRGTFDWVVDATHPYAVEATANIRTAAAAAGLPYLRLLRQAAPLAAGAHLCTSAGEAAAALCRTMGNILLTTGSKELSAFAALPRERLYVRVLPTQAAIRLCEKAQIPHSHIIAMQGPFGEELNRALIGQFSIAHLVTKDGGTAGGFLEKQRAAAACGTALWVIRRPSEAGLSYEKVLRILRRESEETACR